MAPFSVRHLTAGAGVTVAVVDTGVSRNGSGLDDAVAPGDDVVAHGRADSDCFGRGTALAAIVAARPVDSSALVGVAPAARILPVRIVDGEAKVPPGALAAGIRVAVHGGADVILIGVGGPADAATRGAIDEAAASDVLVVAAVANENSGTDGARVAPWYPASDPRVLAVGGVNASGSPTETVSRAAGRDLVAPGTDVLSEGPVGPGNYRLGGAAAAAAYAAGAAALVRAYRPQLTASQVRDRLKATAAPGGELDVYFAVTGVDPHPAGKVQALQQLPLAMPAKPRTPVATILAVTVAGGVLVSFLAGWTVATSVRQARRRRQAVAGGSR